MALIEFIKDVGGVVRLHFRDNLGCVVRVKVFQDVDCHVLVEFSKSVSCVLAGHTPQSADLGLEVEIFQMIGKVGGVYERRLVGGIPALIAFLLLVIATPVPILRAASLCFFLHGSGPGIVRFPGLRIRLRGRFGRNSSLHCLRGGSGSRSLCQDLPGLLRCFLFTTVCTGFFSGRFAHVLPRMVRGLQPGPA